MHIVSPAVAHAAPGAAVADPWLSFQDLKERKIVRSRATLARWIRSHGFPKPAELGPNTIRWRLSWITAWEDARAAARVSA